MSDHRTDAEFAGDTLRGLSPVEPSMGLVRRVAQLPIEHPRKASSPWPFQSLWMPLLAGAFAAALGVTTGLMTLEDDTQTTSGAAQEATASEESVDDLLVLAWGGDSPEWDEQLSLETP